MGLAARRPARRANGEISRPSISLLTTTCIAPAPEPAQTTFPSTAPSPPESVSGRHISNEGARTGSRSGSDNALSRQSASA